MVCKMVNILALLVLATFFLSSQAKWSNIRGQTVQGNKCDFSAWYSYGVSPAYEYTCNRQYRTWAPWWYTSLRPWCYVVGGGWGDCEYYRWNVEYPNPMINSQSKRKEYSYSYNWKGKPYAEAKRTCQSLGEGWDVANFQSLPSYVNTSRPSNNYQSTINYKKFVAGTERYNQAVANIMDGLSPLIQTWHTTFWVKNQEDENGNSGYCLDFDADRTEGTVSGRTTSVSGFSDHADYESSRFQYASCSNRANHFVCEKDLD